MSFSILLFASIVFYGLLANTRRADARARTLLTANSYARQLMEAQQVKTFSDLKVGTTTASKTISTDRAVGAASATNKGSMLLTSQVIIADGPGTGVRSIVVLVTWTGGGRIQLETYVTQ